MSNSISNKKDDLIKFRTTKDFKNLVKKQAKVRGFETVADYLRYLVYFDSNK